VSSRVEQGGTRSVYHEVAPGHRGKLGRRDYERVQQLFFLANTALGISLLKSFLDSYISMQLRREKLSSSQAAS